MSEITVSTETWRSIQNWSGLAFSSFMFLHIPTTISAAMGPFGYNEALKVFRKYYQFGLIEAGLGVSLAAHVAAGVALRARRPSVEVPWYTTAQRWSGIILSALVPVHAFATRGLTLLGKQKASEYDHIRSTMVGKPALFFVPYYMILVGSGIYHTISGLSLILTRLGYSPFSHSKLSEKGVIAGISAVVTAAAYAGIFAFATKEGIPENFKYWRSHLPPALQ